MQDLRSRLRIETKEIHDLLEVEYPFKQLVEATCTAKSLDDVIFCFYQKFNALVQFKSGDEEFYFAISEIFEKYHKTNKVEKKSFSHLELLSLEYLLLGSRMGNSLILKKNPEIKKILGSEYLTVPFPSTIWKELLVNISNIKSKSSQDKFIKKVKEHYQDLIHIGNKLKA